jgi:hypothetical protein
VRFVDDQAAAPAEGPLAALRVQVVVQLGRDLAPVDLDY